MQIKIKKEIKQRFYDYQEDQLTTVQQVCKKIGVNPVTMYKIFKQLRCSPSVARRLIDVFGEEILDKN